MVGKDPIVTPFGTTSATVSMGVTATCLAKDGTVAELLHEADMSLYAAKKNGRNRIEIAAQAASSSAAHS